MLIGVPQETLEGEQRVAATPDSVKKLAKLGYEIQIESGAGTGANFLDAAFEQAGATIVADTKSIWASSDIVVKVNPPTDAEIGQMKAVSYTHLTLPTKA